MLSDIELRIKTEEFQRVCRENGIKMTHQRLVIFQAVVSTDEHPDAEAVFRAVRAKLPTVSLDTVYRTLWMLNDLGLITTLGPQRESVRFDANTSRHHHFICNKCGLAIDFYSPEFDGLAVPDEIKSKGSIEATQVEIRGICNDCLAKVKKASD